MDKKLLGKRIRIARKNKGLTGEKLAEVCNIATTYLRQMEGGAKTPSLPMFVLLCENLDVTPNYLLADIVPDNEISDIPIIVELWRKASPQQIRTLAAILRAALDTLPE